MLVKVDKFIFLVDFVILDIDEEVEVPLILGWPFLVASTALIDVTNWEMVFRVGEEKIVFKLHWAMTYSSSKDDTWFLVDVTNDVIFECV